MHRGPGRDRVGLRSGLRLRPHIGKVDLARGQQSGGRCDRRRPETSPASQHPSRHRGRQRAWPPHAQHRRGDVLRAVVGRRARLPRDHRRRQRPHGGNDPLLAHLDRPRPHSRSPLAIPHHALGARHQGAYLPADRGHGRCADDFPARDARRRAQLGLPLQLDARFDVHAAGAALAEPRLGSQRVHGIRRRPQAQRRRRPADHVRHRWPPRSHRVHARRPVRLRRRAPGTHRQRCVRPAPERRLRRRAGIHPAAYAAKPETAPPSVADRPVAGRVRRAGVARAGPGHLGGARRAPALCLLEADELGRPGSGGPPGRDPRRSRPDEEVAGNRQRDPSRYPGPRTDREGRPASAL